MGGGFVAVGENGFVSAELSREMAVHFSSFLIGLEPSLHRWESGGVAASRTCVVADLRKRQRDVQDFGVIVTGVHRSREQTPFCLLSLALNLYSVSPVIPNGGEGKCLAVEEEENKTTFPVFGDAILIPLLGHSMGFIQSSKNSELFLSPKN
ncbi:hypothetical protein F2Q70_00035371 [Brassica cretica]|uniref:Uncharacterized protein n=1 Tax=Brassica cretica TaxID=69181 RepID=A0A8S9JR28_BRACR|nr:hypothetical protein F2Q70_00035371 [Brassica cretica]